MDQRMFSSIQCLMNFKEKTLCTNMWLYQGFIMHTSTLLIRSTRLFWSLFRNTKNVSASCKKLLLVTTKSRYLKILKSQYLSEFLRYWPDFLHVIINFAGLKITYSSMGLYGTFSLISEGWSKWQPPPAFSWESKTSPLIGLISSFLVDLNKFLFQSKK